MINDSVFLRRELMLRFVRAFNNGTLEMELDRFPIEMRPDRLIPAGAAFIVTGRFLNIDL